MKKTSLLILLAGLTVGSAYSDPLKTSDPEYSQLSAMGYEISASETGSIAQRNNVAIWISKDVAFTFLARNFTLDPRKVEKNETKALQAVNKLNLDLSYVLAISADKDSLVCGSYYRGPHDRKQFAATVSEIESCNIIFNLQPVLLTIGE
jgi:hypothetical protein